MSEYKTIKEYEHEGWHISVALAPDYHYLPGEDDDVYPRFETARWDDEERPRDYDGQFLPSPIIVFSRNDRLKVTPEEIARLIEISGGSPRRMRKQIESDARAIANEDLTWAVVRVTASRGHIEGTDYLGAVEYDQRERDPDAYALSVVEDYGMAKNAIEDAARSVCGDYATLALSY